MAPRARQSTAGPTQRRPANELPAYQKPTFPLNPAAQRALAQLNHSHNLKKLDESFQEAEGALSISAAEINDRLTAKERDVKKRKTAPSSQQDVGAGANDGLEQELTNLRDRVERMTQRMDESMRKMIDSRHNAQAIVKAIEGTATEARANASTQASTQIVPTQTQRSRAAGIGNADNDDEDEDGEYRDFIPTDPAAGTQAQPSPLEAFRTKLESERTRYQNYSFTARYADDNDYRNFRKVVHDAKYPDDEVPLPHHSEWFKEQGAPAPGVTTRTRNADGQEDDDIAVSKATISTKCPLTLVEFKTPLTSKKCPHSFESEAILSLIASSRNRVDNRPNGKHCVQCPVQGCIQYLTREDLHTDKVLIRKIKRVQKARELDDEDMEENGSGANGKTGSTPTVIEDDDGADVDDIVEDRVMPETQMKKERNSTANTAPPPATEIQSTVVVDLGGGSEDEAEEDNSMEE